ncbi:unnamed protein product, partial [Scytosiphon promiscuus]
GIPVVRHRCLPRRRNSASRRHGPSFALYLGWRESPAKGGEHDGVRPLHRGRSGADRRVCVHHRRHPGHHVLLKVPRHRGVGGAGRVPLPDRRPGRARKRRPRRVDPGGTRRLGTRNVFVYGYLYAGNPSGWVRGSRYVRGGGGVVRRVQRIFRQRGVRRRVACSRIDPS